VPWQCSFIDLNQSASGWLREFRALEVLPLVAGMAIAPDVVAQECTHDQRRTGAQASSDTFAKGWLKPQPKTPLVEPIIAAGLFSGESMALAPALRSKPQLLLMNG
jgi:hypothetical protein